MNLRPFILVPLLGLNVSCDTLNEPIYYDTAGQAIPKPSVAQAPIAPIQQTSAQLPNHTTPAPTPAASVRKSPPSSPFMQPDVLGLPARDVLKETSASTPSSGGSSGLTVPSR
ncbi:hypothetical protein [Rubritalea sp.]|uniref:hypothetical protein n=1 Tax=Rubritalea sp. TaxID=2109375 RepID=UPI003EF0C1A7